jgi:hypothetical protein
MSESGIVMRTSVDSISMIGRAAQGVHVMGVGQGDRVACVATIDLSKTPAPAEIRANTIDDLALQPEPGDEKPARRRRAPKAEAEPTAPDASEPVAPKNATPKASKDSKPENGSNGRGRARK